MHVSDIAPIPSRVWLMNAVTMVVNPALAGAIPVCSGGDRAASKLTCIVHGDTGWSAA